MNLLRILGAFLLASVTVLGQAALSEPSERIALNFMRPDANRPGQYDFTNNGPWLVGQFKQLGVQWNRMAFSWVVAQPEENRYDWAAYDRIVDACERDGIQILATLGGHFDRPPVPAWSGESLAEVVEKHPERLEAFTRAWVEHYKGRIHYYEILNEPGYHHKGLTVKAYCEGILKPAYRIVKSVDPQAKVLPCSYHDLPILGQKEEFWDLARGSYDIANYHVYEDWGRFRTNTTAEKEERTVKNFRAEMQKHGEADKPLWITEIGWWGSGSLREMAKAAENDPEMRGKFKPFYTGREYLDHPVVAREDKRRAEWMKDMFPRLLAIPGCEKVFLWVSMDEFEGGFNPEALYGAATEGQTVKQVDLWGIIAGDRKWRESADVMQAILRRAPKAVSLFDGRSLDGWEGDTNIWRVRDGVIVGGSMNGNPRNEFLATMRSYTNFILRLEYKLVGTEGFINSGVQFRSVRLSKPSSEMKGYQADIGAGYSGCLYDESRRNAFLAHASEDLVKKIEKPGDWNQYEIRANGPRIRLWLNGEKTLEYTEADASLPQTGLFGLQIHGGSKAEVMFRNIEIQELP